MLNKTTFVQISILLFYAFFCWLMLGITLQYIPLNSDVAFLRIKQDYIGMIHYKVAFFTHVYSSILVLLAGFTQFSKWIRREYHWLHKWSGWLYVGITVFVAAPSGFVIGVYANGGLPSQIAFCLLAVFWFGFTVMAMVKLFQKKIIEHQYWMWRSFALAMSAITLRAWKYILVALFQPKPMDLYMIVAWLGWVGNWIIIEMVIWWIIWKMNYGSQNKE